MGQDKYQAMGDGIYAQVGGPQNVAKLIHCMTRVRMTIKDEAKVNVAGLKKFPASLVSFRKKPYKSSSALEPLIKSRRPWSQKSALV